MIGYTTPLKFNKTKYNPNPSKNINVGFILLNHDKMTIKQMANELGCSTSKVYNTIKEFQIPYNPKFKNEINQKKKATNAKNM